ncbi:MAG: HD domain-containing phosphohydrolase [Gemmatimonadota bacterium]
MALPALPDMDHLSIVATARCLVVDDDGDVRAALCKVMESQGFACFEAANGVEALAVLRELGEVPLIITDIVMPEMDGVALLVEVRSRYPDTAVIMLTGVAEVTKAVECMQKGALDYMSKPVLLEEVRTRVASALETRHLRLQNRFYQQHLEARVQQLVTRDKERLLEGVTSLAHALEAKDGYTRGHSRRVARYAVKTAVQLGYTGEFLEQIRLGAELHDIGKIGTRESVLNKPGPLSPEEFKHITEHTLLGEHILRPFLREKPVVLRIVRSHHERMDGSGFPDGLSADAIPIEARIVAVADAFDAMTTTRAYRQPHPIRDAIEEVHRCAGTHFDPAVVRAFFAAFPDPAQLPISTEESTLGTQG